MGGGFSKMKKQARMMQNQMSALRDNLQNTQMEGSAGNGLVTVILNGEKELKKITIKPECLQCVDGLQDLIVAAFQDASKKVDAAQPVPQMPF